MAGMGFIPIGGIDGRPYNGATMRCVVLGAVTDDLAPGDLVKLNGTGDADGVPSVIKSAGGEVILGAIVSVEPSTSSSLPYAAGAITTDQYVNVAVATDQMLFKCQTNTAIAKTSIGLMADHAWVQSVTPYWTSKSVLDVTSGTGTTGKGLEIVGVLQDGVDITDANKVLIVRVVEPQMSTSLASVGV